MVKIMVLFLNTTEIHQVTRQHNSYTLYNGWTNSLSDVMSKADAGQDISSSLTAHPNSEPLRCLPIGGSGDFPLYTRSISSNYGVLLSCYRLAATPT